MTESRLLRRLAWAVLSPFERRLAVVVGRLITDKLAHSGLDRIHESVGELAETVRRTDALLTELSAQIARSGSTERQRLEAAIDSSARVHEEVQRVMNILQLIYDEEPENRRRLWRLRESEAYELAFDEPEPLVSIVIPTYENHQALRERALPSALGQTYGNLEVVIVGDSAPDDTAKVVAELNDGRVRFHNLNQRGPYSEDPHKLWLVGGAPPYNTAVRMARGRWIAYLSDDDSFRPDHLARLMTAAKADRLELCYGLLIQHNRDGSQTEIGAFPPSPGQFGFQAAIYHAGLADFMEFELADAEFGQAVDWGLCRRMLRAGVRMGIIREPTADYFPSWDWAGRKERHAQYELSIRGNRKAQQST